MKLADYLIGTIDNRGRNPENYLDKSTYPVLDNYLIKNELHPCLEQVNRFIDSDTYKNFLRGYTYPGMVVMTLVGNGIGNVTTIPDNSWVIIQNTIGFSVSKDKLSDQFLYYYLLSINDTVKKFDRGSGQPSIRKTDILDMEVDFPSLVNQQKIAAVLSALDSKIELNTKINNNLEQQFNELYKQYFSSEQSERWDSVPLSEMIFFQEGPGIRNWQYVAENGTKFINIRCINDGDINTATANMISNEEATGKYKHFMLEENDIVMSCSGTLGRYAIVRKEHLPLCLNTSVIRFRSIEQAEDFTYIYGYLTSPEFLNKQAEMACGSVQSNFGPTHLKKITMKKPPKELRLAFHERARPLLNAIIHNRRESAHLAIVRDALLPKLMSGEIDVSKVDISDPSYLDKLLFSEETE